MCFAAFHGQDVAFGVDAAAEWWAQTAATPRQRMPPECPIFLLADANAKLGSVPSPFVGEHQADPQSAAGELLHELLAEQGPGHSSHLRIARGGLDLAEQLR